MRRLIVAGAVLVSACQLTNLARGGADLRGYTFPYVLAMDCPGEQCPTGRWLACDSTPIRARPGKSERVVGQIARGDRFDVVSSALVVLKPGVVRVTRAVRQGEDFYDVGDTLAVLGHLGEGWFAAVHNGQARRVQIFWPRAGGGGWPINGDVLRENVSEMWIETSFQGRPAWVAPGSANLVSPYGRVEPLKCSGS